MISLFLCTSFVTQAQTLVWQDNFDGTTINTDYWSYDFGDGCERSLCGWGNNELQYYTSRTDNARVSNGNLIIEAKRENFLTREFTSARIKTEGRIHFKYGTVEARIKVPNLANGLWPAFWLLGNTGAWPANGEIDIAEMGIAEAVANGTANRFVGGAVHWSYNGSQADYGDGYSSPVNLNDDYHVYKMTWDPTFIRVYIDNIEYFSFDISNIAANSLEEFHIPHYLILNLAVGGTYTGITNAAGITAPMPGQMLVDYIRLYQDSPGSELYVGKNNAKVGTYGVFTENTPVNDKITYGTNGDLFLWNNLTTITGTPYEGSQQWAFRANAGSWFGMGVATPYTNMSNFYQGNLKFHMKTTSTHTFRVGVSTGHGDSWVTFTNGGSQYGLVRDGSWHEVSIPFSAFTNLDLYSVKQMFMLVADPPAANMDFFIDNVFYSGGGVANVAPSVSITSPSAGTQFTVPASIVINATAADTDGTISKVEFFNGSVKLGEDTTNPYSYTWSGVAQGSYSITAVATDNGGLSTTSSAVSVTVNPSNTLPSPWLTADIGAVGASGNASYSNGTFTVGGSGADIWGTADEFRFVYQSLTGNGAVIAQVNSLTNSDGWAKAGVMIRESTAANAIHALTAITPANGVAFQRRTATGGTTAHTGVAGIVAPRYVKIERNGSTITSSYSSNGTSWTVVGSASMTMSTTILVGLCVTSHNDGVLSNAAFSNVSVTSGNTPPTVSITAPLNGASFTAPASVTINANAADANGTITKVDFYNGSTLLGTDATSPYSYSWTGVAAGNYSLTAVATDNGGATTTSTAVAIVVNAVATNLALNKTVTVSSTEGTGFEGARAVDGNLTSTRWSSTFSDPQWLYVDLGASYAVNRVNVTWEAAYGRDYLVQVSADANSWTTIKTITGNTLLANDHTNLSGTGRYVRIYGTARGTVYGYSIFELEVYGTPVSSGCSGSASNGDYTYQVSSANGTVNWTFVPQSPIVGSTMCILYVKVGAGGYAGYNMTAAGSNFTFSQSQVNGSLLTFYFTYRVGNTTAERNSSANPHTYTVGTSCSGARQYATVVNEAEETIGLVHPNPARQEISIDGIDGHDVSIVNMKGSRVFSGIVNGTSLDITSLPAGSYIVLIRTKDNKLVRRRFMKL